MLFISGKLEPTSKYNNMRLCSLDAQFPHWRHLLAFYFLIVTFLCVSENTSGSKVEKPSAKCAFQNRREPPQPSSPWPTPPALPVDSEVFPTRLRVPVSPAYPQSAQNISPLRRPGGIPSETHWLLLMQSSSGFTLSPSWMTKLLIQSPKIPTLQWWRGLYAWVIPGAVLSGPTWPYSPG